MTQEEEYQIDLGNSRAQQRMEGETAARQQPPPKAKPMGWGIFSVAMFFCIIGDTIDILTVGTIGWLTGLFVDFILFIILGTSKSGRKQWKKWVVGILGESIPIINILPLRSIFTAWSFVSSRSAKLQVIGNLAGKVSPRK